MTAAAKSLAWTLVLGLLAGIGHAAGPTAQEIALGHQPVTEDLNELRQSVTLLPGGGYAVVWDEGAGPSRAIRLQYVRPDGSLVFPGGGLTVASSAHNNFFAVTVAHPSSGVFVAFQQVVPGLYANQVLVQWIDGKGRRRWPGDGVAAVEAPVDGTIYLDAHLAADNGGGVYVCYMVSTGGDDERIGCQHLDAGGERLWLDTGLEVGGSPGWRTLPRVVTDGAGGILVFWRNQRLHWEDQTIDPMLLEGQRFAPDGTRLWGSKAKVLRTLNLKESGSYMNGSLDVVSDGHGGAVLAFEDWVGNGPLSLDLFALRVTGSGRRPWGLGVALATGPTIQQGGGIVAAPDGGAFVAVTEYPNTTRSRLLLFRLGPTGRHLWAREGVALSDPQSKTNEYGPYGSFDNGRLRMAWIHQRQLGTATMDIHLAVFDAAGRRLSPKAGIPLNTAQDMQFLRGFVFDPKRNQGFALFWDRRSGTPDDMDVYGALYREQ